MWLIGCLLHVGAATIMGVSTSKPWSAWVATLILALAGSAEVRAHEFQVDMIQFDPWALRNPVHDEARPYVGIVVDLLDEFERRSGHKTQRVLAPYARVELDLEQGQADFSIMAWGDARGRYANRGTCLVPLDFGVRARKGVVLDGYESLSAITTSASRGLKVDPRFDADPAVRKDYVMDYTTGVRKTAVQRDSDAVAGHLATINYLIDKHGLGERFGDTLLLRTTHLSVAFSKASPRKALESQVQQVFQAMVEDGTARRIYDRWLGRHRQGLSGEAQAPNCR